MTDHKQKNYYELLGITREASMEQIKIAYRDLARVYHPDSNFYAEIIDTPPTKRDEEIFKLVTAAYDTLMDPEKRAQYNRTLLVGVPGWSEGDNGQQGSPSIAKPANWEQMAARPPSTPRAHNPSHTAFGKGNREEYVSKSSIQRTRPVAEMLQSTRRTIADKFLLFVGLGLPLLTLAAVAIYLMWFAKRG
jgi:DnaJ-class molecular chaperone